MKLLVFVVLCGTLVSLVHGHARLIQPPSRASMWRFGFENPPDYNDNEGFCGGMSHQHYEMDGKCGICGDPWDQNPRQHEVGGTYANGIIVDTFKPGETIEVTVDVTANHLGYFEFRVCEVLDESQEVLQECLDRNVLQIAGEPEGTTMFFIGTSSGPTSCEVVLPEGLTCAHCVLQWTWISGNNYGECEDGSVAQGCGPQENFRACSDITIGEGGGPPEPTEPYPGATTGGPIASTTTTTTPAPPPPGGEEECTKAIGVGDHAGQEGMDEWCTVNCAAGFCPEGICECIEWGGSGRHSHEGCPDGYGVPTGLWSHGGASMKTWCLHACNADFCPAFYCRCVRGS